MRKLYFTMFLAFFFLSTISTASAQIVIRNPSQAGVCWWVGETYMIKYLGPRGFGQNVNIYLVTASGDNIVHTIAQNEVYEGWYWWTIPNTIASGEYRIRVTSVDQSEQGDSVVFHISDLPPDRRITITYPNLACKIWFRGTRYKIEWQPSPCLTSKLVNIYLVREDGSVAHTIATNLDIGRAMWLGIPIPSRVPLGRYRIKVATTDNKGFGVSHVFEAMDPPGLKAIAPRSGSRLIIGEAYHIKWESTPIVKKGQIRIRLHYIKTNVWLDLYHGPDTGDFYWRIDGRDVTPGFVDIVIESPQFTDAKDIIKKIKLLPPKNLRPRRVPIPILPGRN